MTDSTPKQRENEKKFMEPALDQLQPYYADLFETIMRGKRRGDGLMIDPETKDQLEGRINKLSKKRKKAREDIADEERRSFYREELGLSKDQFIEEWITGKKVAKRPHDLVEEGLVDKDNRSDISDQIDERVSERANELPEISDDDRFTSEAVYLINTIQSDDRGSMNIKAQFMSTYLHSPDMLEKRSRELKAVAKVFEKYRSSTESVDVTVDEKVEKLTGRIYGDEMADTMKERGRKRQEFIEQEVIR